MCIFLCKFAYHPTQMKIKPFCLPLPIQPSQNRHSNNRAPELWHKASQPHRKQEAPKQLMLGTTFTHSSTHSVLLSRAKGHEHKNRAFSQSEKLICYLCSGKTREEMGKVLMPQIMKYVILFRYEVVWKVKVAVIQ